MADASNVWFDDIEPFDSGFLRVSEIHEIYYEQCGNPEGIPIVYLHGGPGAGFQPKHRRMFDPQKYRVVLFDQRGAGRSKPVGSLKENTIAHLAEDIEKLRRMVGVDAWGVYGSSWGSALALYYAIKHPRRVLGMVLAGVFLAEKEGTYWIKRYGGAQRFFPEEYEEMLSVLSEVDRDDPEAAFLYNLKNKDKAKSTEFAKALMKWEGGLCGMEENLIAERKAAEEAQANGEVEEPDVGFLLNFARIQAHYDANGFFLEEGFIMRHARELMQIPMLMVHGRYDIVCPLANAWRLHKLLPLSHLSIVPNAGHSSGEMAREIKIALGKLAKVIEGRWA